MSILDKNDPYYQQFIKNMQTSWTYRCLEWVTPRQAGWVFCGLALLTIFLVLLSIYGDNTNYTYTYLAMVMALFTILAGMFGLLSWSIDRYIIDEKTRIAAKGGLYSGVIIYLFIMIVTILQSLH